MLTLQAMFTVLLGPFTYFDVQKTKYLQIITTLFRWMGKRVNLFLNNAC